MSPNYPPLPQDPQLDFKPFWKDKKNIAIIIMAVLLVAIVAYYFTGRIANSYYRVGYNQGDADRSNQFSNELNNNGFISMTYTPPGSNKTIPVKLVPQFPSNPNTVKG